MQRRDRAIEYFKTGCGCAQSILCAYSDVIGLDEKTALRLGSSFGGGMGKLREVCGALSGAFMVAGLLWGDYDPMDHKAKSAHYALVRRIAEEFKTVHGTINCARLVEGIANAKGSDPAPRTEEYYAVRPCVKFVATAAEILDRIIEEKVNINLMCHPE